MLIQEDTSLIPEVLTLLSKADKSRGIVTPHVIYFSSSLIVFVGKEGREKKACKMKTGSLRWCSWCSNVWTHMASFKHLPGEWRESGAWQQILTEREIEMFADAWFRSVFIQLLWSLFNDYLVGKFPCKQLLQWGSPCWSPIFCQRIWDCFLTVRRCNFSCCLPLPSLNFSSENNLLTTTHYFTSNLIYLSRSWNSVLCTTECPLRSSPMEQLLCPLVYAIYLPVDVL